MPSKQDMKFKTTMEKELNIIPPIGYEIDKQKSTFEKIIFKKIPENPKTWEEYCELTKGEPSFFADCENVISITSYIGAYNEFSTNKRAKQYIALGKLLQLRDYWVGGWKPNLPINPAFAVINTTVVNMIRINLPLTFPTKEMAQKFVECFKYLINEAYPLV